MRGRLGKWLTRHDRKRDGRLCSILVTATMSLNLILNRDDGVGGRRRLPSRRPDPRPSAVNSREPRPTRTPAWQRRQPVVMNSSQAGQRNTAKDEPPPPPPLPWKHSQPFMDAAEARPPQPVAMTARNTGPYQQPSPRQARPGPLSSLNTPSREPYKQPSPTQARPGPLASLNTPSMEPYQQPFVPQTRPGPLASLNILGTERSQQTPREDAQPSAMDSEPPQPRKGLSITDILNTEPSQPETESLSPTKTTTSEPPLVRPGPLPSIVNTPNDRGSPQPDPGQAHHNEEPSQSRTEESKTPPVKPKRAYRKKKASQPKVDKSRTVRATRNHTHHTRDPPEPKMKEPQTLPTTQATRHQLPNGTGQQAEINMEDAQNEPKPTSPQAHHDPETPQPPNIEPQTQPAASTHGLRHIQPRPISPEIPDIPDIPEMPVAKRVCTSSKKVVLPPRSHRRRHLLPYEETMMWIAPPAPTEHPATPNWVFGNGKGIIHPASPAKMDKHDGADSLSPKDPPSSQLQHPSTSKWTFGNVNGNGNGNGVAYPVLPEGVTMAPPPPPHIQLPPTAHWVFGKNGVAYATLPNRPSRPRSSARLPPASGEEEQPDGNMQTAEAASSSVPAAPTKKRSKFEERERAQTALVREMRACIRCRNQRIRVSSN